MQSTFANLNVLMMTFGFQVLRKMYLTQSLEQMNNMYTFCQEQLYIWIITRREAQQMSPSHSTFTQHMEHRIHNRGSLNTEPQFNFSSVRLKFKTGTSSNLVSRMEMTYNHSRVVALTKL